MERELTWSELVWVVEEHEAHHNYRALKTLCERYYPEATCASVQAVQEYNDNDYYYTCGPSNLTVWAGDRELLRPADEVGLLTLLAASPGLRAFFPEVHPDPLGWLWSAYAYDVGELELRGPERGIAVEVDLTLEPPQPTRVYVKEPAGDETDL